MPRSTVDDRLLIATSNKGKVTEVSAMLAGLNRPVISLTDLPRIPPPVEESGTTFAENALIKAVYYHTQTGMITLADDSGLEVDALGGRPGVYSARYGGYGATSSEQIARLLDELKGVPEERRSARFVCCMAVAGPGLKEVFEGRCDGFIAFEPRGEGGFGYDPIFIDSELGLTFAQLTGEEKASRSHRGKALRAARRFIESLQR